MRRFLFRVEAITAAAVKTTNVAVAPDGHRAMFVGRAPNARRVVLDQYSRGRHDRKCRRRLKALHD